MKNNKLIAINKTQQLLSQTEFNCKVKTKGNTNTLELTLFIQELTTVIQEELENNEEEKDLLMDKIRRLQS